jgi:hypothetical protein
MATKIVSNDSCNLNLDVNHLRHLNSFLTLLVDEYKVKAKRLALESAYYKRLYKQVVRKEVAND